MPASLAQNDLDYYSQRVDPNGPSMTDAIATIDAAALGSPGCTAYNHLQSSVNPFLGAPFDQFHETRTGGAFTFATWTLPGDGTVRAMGKCLDVRGGSILNGTAVQVYSCNNTLAQQWTYDLPTGELKALGKCLDATSYGTLNGTRLQLWDCGGGTNQKWTIPSVG